MLEAIFFFLSGFFVSYFFQPKIKVIDGKITITWNSSEEIKNRIK